MRDLRPQVVLAFRTQHPYSAGLEAREGEEHLIIDQKQASVCRLGAALERQGLNGRKEAE